MFDFGNGKMILVAIVALVLVGPKDLPFVLRALGRAAGRLRSLQARMWSVVMDVVAETDLDGVAASLSAFERGLRGSIAFDPATAMRGSLPLIGGAVIAPTPPTIEDLLFVSPEMENYLSSTSDKPLLEATEI